MELSQEEKAAKLQYAVINSSVEELCAVCDALGDVEMSAPALGLACRFRGLAAVRALVEWGASFCFPSTRRIEERYGCYIGRHYGNYRTNYSLYLLRAFDEDLKRAFCFKGMSLAGSAERDEGEPLSVLADTERVAVLRYLLENREKVSFQPEEMFYYALFFRDMAIVEELDRHDVGLLEIRVQTIANGANAMSGYWLEYVMMTEQADDAAYLDIMGQIAAKLGGKPFHYTDNLLAITKKRFRNVDIFEFFLAHFKREKMKKYQIIRDLIDEDATESLARTEREGWLAAPNKRDEMIAYATHNGKTEALAWLLDYKNRTADFVFEQKKAEKKLMRELSAAPDSVAVLKQIWSYRKREDNTLMITNYKGKDIEVTVPKRIGRGVVTAIGKGAFSGTFHNSKLTYEQVEHHKKITKVTLPDTIELIDDWAFARMTELEEIIIPAGVQEIGGYAFAECVLLKSLTIPGNVQRIGISAVSKCNRLESVCIEEGVPEIGECMFWDCGNLRQVRIPQSVQKMGAGSTGSNRFEIFEFCPKVNVLCPKGSAAEAYCKENKVRFCNSVEEETR
ncbi:MAG: leucine-rich repeat domain-containing protein [Lachnospiraceae bacterium]|nr:leucine-rich repeat domain-containing protein [Lachnospiraceae bacterium]